MSSNTSIVYVCKQPRPCADPESIARGGPNLITFFVCFLYFIEDPNTAWIGPLSARKQNAIKMAFRWWADDGPTLNACLLALFDLIFLRPINNLSVIKLRVFLDWTSTKLGLMFLLKDTTQWRRWGSNRGPLVSSQALYHWAPALPY